MEGWCFAVFQEIKLAELTLLKMHMQIYLIVYETYVILSVYFLRSLCPRLFCSRIVCARGKKIKQPNVHMTLCSGSFYLFLMFLTQVKTVMLF